MRLQLSLFLFLLFCIVSNAQPPTIDLARYNFVTGELELTGSNFQSNPGIDDIDITRLTISNGVKAHQLTSATTSVDIVNSNSAVIFITGTDKTILNSILNNSGTTSDGGMPYNLEAADGWNIPGESDASTAIEVSNYSRPEIVSSVYNASTGILTVSAKYLSSETGINNDIDASKISIVGNGGSPGYQLNTDFSVDILSENFFTIAFDGAHKENIEAVLNHNGSSAWDNTNYILNVADGWCPGSISSTDISDNNNPVEVTGVLEPEISGASYNFAAGELTLSGINLQSVSGDDINANKITLTDGSLSYTLVSTPNVEIFGNTSATILVSPADRVKVNYILNQNGSISRSGGLFKIQVKSGWNGNSTEDLAGKNLVVSNYALPAVNSVFYNASASELTIVGSNFASFINADSDVAPANISIAGGDGVAPYTLSGAYTIKIPGPDLILLQISGDDILSVKNLLNRNGTKSFQGIDYSVMLADDWNTPVTWENTSVVIPVINVSGVKSPEITEANYNFLTGELLLSGHNFASFSGNDINVANITVSAGSDSYTLTNATAGVDIENTMSARLLISGTDRARLNYLLNKNGVSSADGSIYNIAVTNGWNGLGEPDPLSPVAVTDHALPVIYSASYNATTGILIVTGENFVSDNNPGNDIDVQKLTVSRGVTEHYIISDAITDVELLTHNSFSFTLSSTDKEQVNNILNWNGNKSYDGSVFYLSAAEDWNAPAEASFTIADQENGINVSGVSNYSPTANNVVLSGETLNGKTLKVTYSYSDLEGDLEGESIFKWYTYSDINGANKNQIPGSTGVEYKLVKQDIGMFISVEVTPVATTGTPIGNPVASLILGPVQNNVPVAGSVEISGDRYVNRTITGNYIYTDLENDSEGISVYKWYRSDDINGTNEVQISGANQSTYVITSNDVNKFISFEVRPVAASGGLQGSPVKSVRYIVLNAPPTASNVTIEGLFKIGLVLRGKYNYSDLEGDAESVSSYNWYRCNTQDGVGKTQIIGANTRNYVVQVIDMGKYISFEVVPSASTGSLTGTPVSSSFMGPVSNSAPVASNVRINGTQAVCKTLSGEYNYEDIEGDAEGATAFRWLRASTLDGIKTPISGATSREYTLTPEDQNKYIFFEVLPRAITGTTTGVATVGNPTGSIVNLLPTATFLGSSSICTGSSTKLTISFTGSSPWELTYTDGSVSRTIVSSDPVYLLDVTTGGTYKGETLVDNIGCPVTNLPSSATINILPLPEVEIVGLRSAYNLKNSPVSLSGTPEGGRFSGPGVISSVNMFYPSIAGTQNSPHAIIYSYTSSQTGCSNKDTVLVEIIDAEADISGIRTSYKYCNFDEPFVITGTNVQGSLGTFSISGGVGLTDNGDNTATVTPGLLSTGNYTISYSYFNGVQLTISKDISVETFEEARIFGLNEDRYCGNRASIEITGNYSEGTFTGECIVKDNRTNKYYFNPALDTDEESSILYSYATSYGCTVSKAVTKLISPVPAVDFEIENVCYDGDSTTFKNLTQFTAPVSIWDWRFGDSESSETENRSRLFEPKHKYSSAGNRIVRLIAGNMYGCRDTLEKTIHLGDFPKVAFSWKTECFDKNIPVEFKNEAFGIDQITSHQWNIEDTSKMNFIYNTKDVLHSFPDIRSYTVKMKVSTEYGCEDSIKKVISLRPVISLKDASYSNNFEAGKGYWFSTDSVSTNNWYFGLPGGTKINTAYSGNNAYYISQNGTRKNQQLVVTSPCFNFTGINRPYVSLSTFSDAAEGQEGAVLQYSVDEGSTWENVGGIGSGNNWFNDYSILSQPGSQQIGWSGRRSNWVVSSHNVDFLKDVPSARFRIVYGQSSKTSGTDGFAFDDVYIGSRSKYLLFEHFTNNSQSASDEANSLFNSIISQNQKDVIDIQYHTSFPGVDTFNIHNPSDPGSRVLYYGIGVTPFSILEGGKETEYTYDYINRNPNANDIKILALKDADFTLSFSNNKTAGKISGSIDIKAHKEISPRNMSLKIVVVEDIVSQVSGKQVVFKNVVKKMLPSAGGTPVTNVWTAGQTETIDFSWDYRNVYNPSNIHLVAFLQDESSREIYQVASDDTIDIINDVKVEEKPYIREWKTTIYPNPAGNTTNIEFRAAKTDDLWIQITNVNGGIVLKEKILKAVSRFELNTDNLPNGIYFVYLFDKMGVLTVNKLIVLH